MAFQDIPQCSERCRSTRHGDIITAVLTKTSISDLEACSFLNYICNNCESVRDSAGRTALHTAASVGRSEVIRWLVQNRHADINAKDVESGYTPLHRSIFYKKINAAIELIKLGANTNLLDNDSLTYQEHCLKDGYKPAKDCFEGEVYAWGSNTNHVLGTHTSSTPELFDTFYKEQPTETVQQICISKFHSVIVTKNGKVFSCGHGQGGRLGLGNQQTTVTPKQVSFSENSQEPLMCWYASISRNHSMFLLSDKFVYTCGLNTHHVLGIFPPPKELLVPKQIKSLIGIDEICAQRYHSVAWNAHCLYTWGLNAGQLGHKLVNEKDKYVISPRAVTALNLKDTTISYVAASDGATAIYTIKGDIILLHEYQCRKIASRQPNIVQLSVIGGTLNASLDEEILNEGPSQLTVVALTDSGELLIWQESDPHLCRCIFYRSILVREVCINTNGIYFVTNDGGAFKGTVKARKNMRPASHHDKKRMKVQFNKFLEKENCVTIKLERIPKIHRALSIASDPHGNDFCIIQATPYSFYEIPEMIPPEMESNIRRLFEEADLNDNIHDIVFNVGNQSFPAHKFVIASKCPYLLEVMNQDKSVLNNENPTIFKQFLMFLYTGSCDLLKCGEITSEALLNLCNSDKNCNQVQGTVAEGFDGTRSAIECYKEAKSPPKKNEKTPTNPVRLLRELSKKFKCQELQNALSHVDVYKNVIKTKGKQHRHGKPVFDMYSFPELCDVTIKCRDGKTLRAHRCILSSRLEYFANLFSMRWDNSSKSEITLPFPKSTALALLEYIYTDTIVDLDAKDFDHVLRLLILSDQFFVARLKNHCEFLLATSLTLKNASQILQAADVYNACLLKDCALTFIVDNLAAFLELNFLNDLSEDLLLELTTTYFNQILDSSCRVITPYSDAPSDETVKWVHNNFRVDLNVKIEKKPTQKRRSRTHRASTSEKPQENESFSDTNLDSVVQFPDIQEDCVETNQKLPDRLRAITMASEKIKDEKMECNFTTLSSQNLNNSFSESGTSFESFPELGSPPCSSHSVNRTPRTKPKPIKVSQKQKKLLSSETGAIPKSPAVAESPKNPWKPIPDISSPISSPEAQCSMDDIISDEKKQKENLVKIQSKPLLHTQKTKP
ncbi:inhibitor of Bruton tyrosine kinase isoform X2 [Aethina tumida]|uniref:inhibitor of Bruton tyrosine kinase isoform X2 n=1 Tax=Aethina tumida TaxID=116153 RepID=UPI00214916FD|nr:inhibitor of Bruton tyrosine kinase isoform X2 [Aethina tumida]